MRLALTTFLFFVLPLASLSATALAAACAESAECPTYFECVDGACAEANIPCTPSCPSHLSCQPTTTAPNPGGGEPAPSGFLCSWAAGSCENGTPCDEGFECVPCEPPELNYSCSNDRCLPSRIPCETHADCPEFFYCTEFTADELPSYWPPGAGRACKPLLGAPTYSPNDLEGGTLVAGGDSADAGAGDGGTSDGGVSELDAGGSSLDAGDPSDAGDAGSVGGGSHDSGAPTGSNADPDGSASGSETASGCGCRTPTGSARAGWLALGALALGAWVARRGRTAN